MAIVVEFFGIPRIRAGVNKLSVLEHHESAELREILREVGNALPEFAEACLIDNQLRDSFIASIDGKCFTSDESTTVLKDQSVLLLSTDAGG